MTFSAIVPCFNGERYLRQCIEALFAQTVPRDDYEVILIDNNSRDRSLEIAGSIPGLIILQEKIQSSYAARNRGVRHSKGEILAFTDADCIVSPKWLEAIGSALADPAAALILGGRRYVGESVFVGAVADYESQKAKYICTERKRELFFGYTNNMSVSREAFLRCGPFLEIARGADSVFVSKVVDAFGVDAVRYAGAAQICHLEIERVSDWYRKQSIYRRSHTNYRTWSRTRFFNYRERFELTRRTILRNRYSLPRALALLAVLATGAVHFELFHLLDSLSGMLCTRYRRSAKAGDHAGRL